MREITELVGTLPAGRWIEPFCGSVVVALNVRPQRALLCDTNIHIIQFYKDIQNRHLTSGNARAFLKEQGEFLLRKGEDHYYEVRERFNLLPNSFDFLFLNRSGFNGMMRFNKAGKFNVPFCRKPQRFSQAYITKIANQIRTIEEIFWDSEWEFQVADFKETLNQVLPEDFVYLDPPYSGRHTDYYNAWSEEDEEDLSEILADLPSRFILSTWHSNKFRANQAITKKWIPNGFQVLTKEHYYHVGATENLRHPMTEALITNFNFQKKPASDFARQQALFIE